MVDTGMGISATFVPDLFAEFEQESEGHEQTHEGSGLGLSVTKQLVGLMGGTIAVVSQKGGGSALSVRLPLAVEEPCTAP